MDPNSVVFDLSSDEEVGWGEKIRVGTGSGDNCDWIQELLDEVDKDTTDESDDVVFVSEVVGNPKNKVKNFNAVVKAGLDDNDDDDDDDCVVLDGDPDKPVEIQNNPVVGESEELVVVGEKGQVACRDYPHPRHLCAKFPFTSTPHEMHCNQCHCYVCDSLAPCLHWGAGHCDATEKLEFWKDQRNCSKNSYQATIPVPESPTSTQLTEPIQINQVPVSTPLEPNYVPQGQVPRPASIRACSGATNFGVPNILNQSKNQRSGCDLPRNTFRPNLILQQHLRNTCYNSSPRNRRHIVGNLGPRVNSSSAMFKRIGSAEVEWISNRKYGSSNNKLVDQYLRRKDLRGQMSSGSNPYRFSSQPNMHTNSSNSVPSHRQQAFQPNVSNILLNSVSSQPLVSPQPNTGNVFVNSVTSQPQIPSQAYVGGMFSRSMNSQPPPQVSSQPIIGSSFANTMPSESQVYGQPNSASNDCRNVIQRENQTPNFLDASRTDIDDLNWVTPTSQSTQQPPAGNSQVQGAALLDESSSLAGIDCLLSESTNPVSLDFKYDWTLDNHEIPVWSPEPALSDLRSFFGVYQ